ncbi:nuclear condensin complex protein [Phaffia rhodozyma]|uniref:Structural maintenance of chromosomes protein n=1 Tax=Phaffia rhodozyma TaxID=264483 RepID=A0A0F7SPU7_PHARH|nr:nuclear condensin complex protein [Phaffia rhodozyma]
MRIEELILEGFKSYPVRTTINGWDPSFNAITGLNGSGKSNILDAICFVLGIQNMTSVRASNLLDLVYKRGQAGITKASVTIVFDNSDRATSPVGFENLRQITVTRQIAVGGATKYLLNGHKSTLQSLQNLFQSVQLNINNPNFLIMQGKITKVLNMKPQEILGMVEEAAGTRMFEERKEKALKTMAKKDKKVAEIKSLLEEEIMPKLDGLRKEKRSYLEYQKTMSELERLQRLVKAVEWQTASSNEAKIDVELKKTQVVLDERKQLITWIQDKQARMEREVEVILKKREKELAKGGKLATLIEAAKALGLEVEKLRTQIEISESNIVEEETQLRNVQQTIKEIESTRTAKLDAATISSSTYASLKSDLLTLDAKVESDESLLQSLLTGLTASNKNTDEATSSGGYMGQVAEAKARLATAGTEVEQAKVRIEHAEREVKEKEPRAKKAKVEGEGLVRELDRAREDMKKKKTILEGLEGDEEAERELMEKKMVVGDKMNVLLETRDHLKSRLASTNFSYSDPYPNFDRSSVQGLVANLIDLPTSSFSSSTALEICAGGKLYNVIVEDEKVASALLANKKSLQKRVTLLPLNKIQGQNIPADKLRAAQNLAPNRIKSALTLVGYPSEVSAAMSFVFGGSVICSDKEAANLAAFQAKLKAITLEGDVYDPSGTLSGGAAPKGAGVLVQVMEVKAVEDDLKGLKREMLVIETALGKVKVGMEAFRKAKRELEIKEHEVKLLEEQVNGSNAARIVAEVAELLEHIIQLKEGIIASKDKEKQAKADIKRLEKEMNDFKNNKDSKLAELRTSIVNQKKAITKSSASIKLAQKKMQTAQLELEQVDQDIESAESEVEEVKANLEESRKQLAKLKKDLGKLEENFNVADTKLKSERAALASFDDELSSLEHDIKAKKQETDEANLDIKKYEHELQTQMAERTKSKNRVADLERQYPWILEESRFFGQPGTVYNFDGFDLAKSRSRCAELEALQKGMRKKINRKVMDMIDSVEKKEAELKRMMSTVVKDHSKIEGTIAELDRYKRAALETTWKKVNGDFGSIFAELLPGNFAKLQAPEGMDITEGLEVKIRLGNVWKASLTELSGGQRSLIALSLIMSLLQFKPAPMYILDEIDAALDLSHTQHIGSLFRNRFKGSQFIVVSLKEGLFTNANVLFKAKFVDGTSTVERTISRSTNQNHIRQPVGGTNNRKITRTNTMANSMVDDADSTGLDQSREDDNSQGSPSIGVRSSRSLIGR